MTDSKHNLIPDPSRTNTALYSLHNSMTMESNRKNDIPTAYTKH